MYLCPTYLLAVAFCVVTMFCWGSWANSQKLVDKKRRYELFYWDYVLGVFVASLVFANTLGSTGAYGRPFQTDLAQASLESLGWAALGGVVFNIANILLVAAIAIAGMSVAFPVGIGLATVLGVIWNYLGDKTNSGNPAFLFGGVALLAIAIILSARSYQLRDAASPDADKKPIGKGLFLALLCGVLMSLFYFFVAKSMAMVEVGGKTYALTLTNLSMKDATLEVGKLTPYTANVLFAFGVLLSNVVVMPFFMRFPFVGEPVKMREYFNCRLRDHFWGWVGGVVWAVGMTFNVIASGVASAAVAYGLGQGATLMSAIWGVFIWREFKGAPKGVGKILTAMFLFFVLGLALIIYTKVDAPAVEQAEIPTFEQLVESGDDVEPGVVESTEEAVENATEAVQDAVESATEAVENAVENATEAAENAVENATEAVENAPEAAENPVDAATEAVENATEAVQDAVENATEAVQDAVENATEAVQDAADAIAPTE